MRCVFGMLLEGGTALGDVAAVLRGGHAGFGFEYLGEVIGGGIAQGLGNLGEGIGGGGDAVLRKLDLLLGEVFH